MASGVTRSSGLTVLLLTLIVWVEAFTVERLADLLSTVPGSTEVPSTRSDSAEPPFDAAQYKEYLTNLKCKEINILHQGIKVPEVATGTIYLQPPTTPQPLSPSPTTAVPVGEQTISSSLPTTKLPASEPTQKVPSGDEKFLEYDDDGDKNGGNEKLPDHNNHSNGTEDSSVLLSGENNDGTDTSTDEECTAPFFWEWQKFNWYQILLDNGGPPGGYVQKGLKANLTKAVDPCSRPVLHLPPAKTETSIEFTHAEFEKVYRTEQVQVRFSGTPLEFVDVLGRLIWSPPNSKRRYFHMLYRKDDTGLYFDLDRTQRCVFKSDQHVRVECEYTELTCDCLEGEETCLDLPPPAAGVPSGLQAALVGGGR